MEWSAIRVFLLNIFHPVKDNNISTTCINKQRGRTMERIYAIDFIKIFSIAAVVVIHTFQYPKTRQLFGR